MNYDFSYYQQSKSHCQKCGRRSRKHDIDQFKCKQQRHFLAEFPPYPILTHNYSRSNRKNVIIDQLIEVQQLDSPNLTNTIHSDRLKGVQQMIYLRENINNLTYREIHFSNQYIILKRLEEKNHLIHQNRFQVDHYCRPLKLQYQTISTLFQNIPITSFTYSKENSSALLISVEMNDTVTNESSTNTDSSIFITPYQEYKHQNYSQNAVQSFTDIDNLTFDTAVIVDVRKCSQVTTYQPSIQLHWNPITPTWSTSLLKNNQQKLFPTPMSSQSIYCNEQPQTKSFPWSQNSNSFNSNKQYTETLHKLKQILDNLQKYLLKKSRPSLLNSTTMTSDSLVTTYSISSTIPILHRDSSKLSYNKSIINVENEISQIEADSLNKNYYSDRIKFRNSAKNINRNQQISDDEETQSQSRKRHIFVQSMSRSFMFILQILLVCCLINRIFMYHIFSVTVENSQSVTATSSAFTKRVEVSDNNEKVYNFISSFF